MRIGRLKRPRYYLRQTAREAVSRPGALAELARGPFRRPPRRRWLPLVLLFVVSSGFGAVVAELLVRACR